MGEDGRNISDDMSSLLHAAEEWANQRLFGTYSSNNLNSSSFYPVCVPIEEVARQVVLEICKAHNWNPETGTDNRLPRQNAIDVTALRQSSAIPILPNAFQDAIVSSSSTTLNRNDSTATPKVLLSAKHVDHQQEISSHTATSEYIVSKAHVVSQNTPLNKSKQLDISDQVIHDNNNNDDDEDIDKTFIIKKNALLGITEELSSCDHTIYNNSKQKSGKFPVTDIIPSSTERALYDNKISTAYNSTANSYILLNKNCSNTLDKNGVSNSQSYSEMGQKFLSSTSEKLDIIPTPNTAHSPANINYRQFAVDNFITSTPHIDSLMENQTMPKILAIRNSGSNHVSSRIPVDRGGSTANSCCARKGNDAMKNVVTVFTANETVAGASTFTTNEINEPALSKTSMNDGNMQANIAKLPENGTVTRGTAIIASTTLQQLPHYSTEKEKNAQVIASESEKFASGSCKCSGQTNASRSGTSCPTLAEETHALTSELRERLDRVQDNEASLLQSVVQKSRILSYNLITDNDTSVTHPEMYSLTAAHNRKPAAGEFNTTLIIPQKISAVTQTECSTYPRDSKNYADLRKNINVAQASQNRLIVDENTDSVTGTITTADNQTQVISCSLENRNSHFRDKQALQTTAENNISLHENDIKCKDMAGKEFITRAVQTDQEDQNERYNNSCYKFDSTPIMSKHGNIFENASFNTPLSALNADRDSTVKKQIEERRSFLNDPIIFFNHMASTPRRKSLPASRAILSLNKSNLFARQTIVRPKTVREIIRKTPTLMTPKSASKVAKSDVKLCLKSPHPMRSVNPLKKSNELPLENRASRLKAEYLAKKRAEQAKKSQTMQATKFTPLLAGRLSVTQKLLPTDPESVAIPHSSKNSNISSHLSASNQTEKKALSPIREMPQTAAEGHAKT